MLGTRSLGIVAFAVVALLSAIAATGWVAHGEAIFLRVAESAWANCL